MAQINYHNVNIYQQATVVLENVDLQIRRGEFVYLIGKVGSGKSSLLKTMYGELDIHSGNAEVLGYDMAHIRRKQIPALRKRIGIVFQDFQLLTDRNVRENLDFVLKATGWSDKRKRQLRITEVLKQVGMDTKGYKMPHELSGGEQQRIVIARAILNTPEIILADEPTGNLDPATGRQIVQLLQNICASGSTVIMTTHNLQLLQEFPGKVFCCEGHRLIENYAKAPVSPDSSRGETADPVTAAPDNAKEPVLSAPSKILEQSSPSEGLEASGTPEYPADE